MDILLTLLLATVFCPIATLIVGCVVFAALPMKLED